MKNLDSKEEAKLIGATEKAIRLSNTGMSPNEAIEKVARENNYTPPYIRLMVSAYNKSKSVHVFKTASSVDRGDKFELADAGIIIKSIYSTSAEHEKIAFELPKDLSNVDFPKLQKVAEERIVQKENYTDRFYKDMSEESKYNIVDKYLSLQKAAKEKLEGDVRQSYAALDRALDTASEHLIHMNSKEFNKVAQLVINSYPKYGQKMAALLAVRSRQSVPELQKTAKAAVFPAREPFLAISRLMDKAVDTVKARNALTIFEKSATDSLLEDFVANLGASSVYGLGGNSKGLENILKKKSDPKSLKEDLDPDFYNQLKEIDARRNFANLALYDNDINKYDFPALIKAYNESAQTVGTEGVNNRVILRNMMLHNLETGGIKDPFAIKTELDIGKALQDRVKNKADIAKLTAETKAKTKELSPEKKIDYFEPPKNKIGDSWSKRLGSILGSGAKDITENFVEKEDEEADKETGKFLTQEARDIATTWKKLVDTDILRQINVGDLQIAAGFEAQYANRNVEGVPSLNQGQLDYLIAVKDMLGLGPRGKE